MMKIEIKEHIKTTFKEVEISCSHGLFDAAKKKINELLELIRQSDQLQNKQKVLDVVLKKLKELEDKARKFEATEAESQNIINELLSSKKKEETGSTAFEKAVTLLMFGQFKRALSQLDKLLDIDSIRAIAAKNIIRCHVGLSSFDNAITQYEEWISSGQFPREELEEIGFFLQKILNQKEIDRVLPIPEKTPNEEDYKMDEEEFIDVLSIELPFHNKNQGEENIKFDVGFQEGNIISLIIPITMTALINDFEVGSTIKDVKIYSTAVVFMDSCIVSEKKLIESGPKEGAYILVMKIQNI